MKNCLKKVLLVMLCLVLIPISSAFAMSQSEAERILVGNWLIIVGNGHAGETRIDMSNAGRAKQTFISYESINETTGKFIFRQYFDSGRSPLASFHVYSSRNGYTLTWSQQIEGIWVPIASGNKL